MSINIVELEKEVALFKDTLVIDTSNDKIVMLLDVCEYGDNIYWMYKYKNTDYKVPFSFEWVPLKGFIDKKKYTSMVNMWNLVNIDKAI